MNQSLDDQPLRDAFCRLKAADVQQTPGWDDVLRRSVSSAGSPPARTVWVVAAFCAAGCVLLGVLLFSLPGRNGESGQGTAHVERSVGSTEAVVDEQLMDVDFARLRVLVDQHFAASDAPEWPVGTDALLTMNVNSVLLQE